MAMAKDSFAEFVRDQLLDLGGVSLRRMFGGFGIYAGSDFFGILHNGRLYFKTDAQSQARYRENGMQAFRPNDKQTLKNYFEVPPDVLEDSEQLVTWAKQAIEAARNDAARKPAVRRTMKRPADRRRVT